ncbi:unnamed protein product [Microthlaspi erraticum]|uniref:Uncharacterized protein n=1 Tax=Microthlaspi erraticum TaxID=1685480 RepID=A0A6D2JLG8_9BRAS|nr:unnamed protein product [Microthlaspi erraticum]
MEIPSSFQNGPIRCEHSAARKKTEMCWTNHVYTLTSLRKEPIGRRHSFHEDRIKEEMLIFNGPITFSYPAAWRMDQWEGAIRSKWMGMGEAAAGVPQRHWLHAEEREIKKERERERPRREEEEEEEEEGGEEEQEEEGAEEEEKIQRRIEFGLERGRLGTGSAGSSKICNLRGRLCWQISFVCKIVMGNLRGRLCRQILFMQAHMLSMTPMWKDHGRLSRQIFRGSCGYSSEAREALPQNRGCSQAHSRTSEPNRIGSVEAVHEGRKTRRITWSAALAEYGTI